jgi:hypothetical protein
MSPDGTILVLLGELNYKVINTWADYAQLEEQPAVG